MTVDELIENLKLTNNFSADVKIRTTSGEHEINDVEIHSNLQKSVIIDICE